MNRTALIVEDDQDALANLKDILELDGFRVIGARSWDEASRQGDWSDFGVILLDRKLPDGTADEMLPRIHQAAPRASLIVITGYADLEGTIAALRAGASDYLLKPINLHLLRNTLDRAVRLREMEERLLQSERLAAIGQMMGVLTHESRNVLARGNALLEMLELEVEQIPAALELIVRLQKTQTDLHRLLEEVRNYAAPIELEYECWDLGSVWRQAWQSATVQSPTRREIALQEQIAGVELKCEVDAFRLDQLFRNLFENALAACRDPAQVQIICTDTEVCGRAAIQIAVRDNGPGIADEDAGKVFMPFYTTKQKGTGLGLAIVKRIVDAHAGSIVVRSRQSSGAEFVITLPRRDHRSHDAGDVGFGRSRSREARTG